MATTQQLNTNYLSENKLLKAEEIATVWKNQFEASTHHLFIKDTIVSIYNVLPTTSYYDPMRRRLGHILDSLWYTAPEILHRSWGDIYTGLVTYIPVKHINNDTPKWIMNIYTLWDTSQQTRIAQFPLSTASS